MTKINKNLPNWISSIRIFLIPPILYFILQNDNQSAWIAVGLFIIAGVSDFFDGYLARKYKRETVIGKFLDPIADKLLMSSCFIAVLSLGKISAALVILIILRDIFIDGLRCVAANQKMVIAAGPLGKWKTALQMIFIPFLFFPSPNSVFIPDTTLIVLSIMWFTVFLSIASAVQYTKGFLEKAEL
jgi:CDP-diacylglycerol--glycerol-3-phosphate 3-phosphatidyltransferase